MAYGHRQAKRIRTHLENLPNVGMKSNKDFEYWINLCLDFNSRAKSSKKKKSMQRHYRIDKIN